MSRDAARTSACSTIGVLILSAMSGAQREVVFPGSAKPIGPYSPGIFAGDYLYVSGQGARDAQNRMADDIEGQTRQVMENIKTIVEAAGLTMDHIVYTHTYLTDIGNYAAMNKVYASYFHDVLPARSTMGVAKMPASTPVEITAIAVRDKAAKQAVTLPNSQSPVPLSPGVLTRDRFYLSGILGRDPDKNFTPESGTEQVRMCLGRLSRVLHEAKLGAGNVVHLNAYHTGGLPREELETALRKAYPEAAISLVEANALPFGVKVGITGLAVRDAKQKRVYRREGVVQCASAGDTVYCAAQEADGIGMALDRIEAGLKALGTELGRAVANNVYLGNIQDFAKMNAGYAERFPAPPPSRTTVQPASSGAFVQVAVVAVR